MAIKTVQIFSPSTPIDASPDFDRLNAPHLPSREILTDLVNRGELPRYRGAETQVVATETEITVTMQWNSRAVAEEYMNAVLAFTIVDDPDKNYMKSIEVIED